MAGHVTPVGRSRADHHLGDDPRTAGRSASRWVTTTRSTGHLPPRRPLSPGTSALSATSLVGITAESGAAIRYTLDGTAPTASRGMVYTGQVRISRDRVLRAVAVDPAGNTSREAVAS